MFTETSLTHPFPSSHWSDQGTALPQTPNVSTLLRPSDPFPHLTSSVLQLARHKVPMKHQTTFIAVRPSSFPRMLGANLFWTPLTASPLLFFAVSKSLIRRCGTALGRFSWQRGEGNGTRGGKETGGWVPVKRMACSGCEDKGWDGRYDGSGYRSSST